MKTLNQIIYILYIFTLTIFYSCSDNDEELVLASKPVEVIESNLSNYTIVIIDSCEYIKEEKYIGNIKMGSHITSLTHKGNCSYCRKRSEDRFQKLLNVLNEHKSN